MYAHILYYLGFLPGAIQILILLLCGAISFFTLRSSNQRQSEPILALLTSYLFLRVVRFIASGPIRDWTMILWFLLGLFLLFKLVSKFGFLGLIGAVLVAYMVIIRMSLIGSLIDTIVTLVGIIIIVRMLKLGFVKLLTYLAIGGILSFFTEAVIVFEVILLLETLMRCLFTEDSEFTGLNGFAQFIFLFIVSFTGVYLIELAFAHLLVMVIVTILVWWFYHTVS